MTITTDIANHLDTERAAIVFEWLQSMPRAVRKCMDREDQMLDDAFIRDFDWDLLCFVYANGDLTGFVQCEAEGDQSFIVHLFCPRKVPADILGRCIEGFFGRMSATRGVRRLIFNVRTLQRLLMQCLLDNGAIPSGYEFQEERQTFIELIWKK